MFYSKKIKKYIAFVFVAGFVFFTFRVFAFFSDSKPKLDFSDTQKSISLDDNGSNFKTSTRSLTVSDFLQENKISLGDHDIITPDKSTPLYSGMNIRIDRASKVKILVDGKKINTYVMGKTVRRALTESDVTLSRLDKTVPPTNTLVTNNLQITVTRINVEEVTKEEPISFKTIVKNDSDMGWQEKKIETPGEKGKKEVKYKITYRDGQEVSRVILSSEVTQAPVSQVEIHGTYMKLGKKNPGQASFYSQPSYLKTKYDPIVSGFAANPWLPLGSYAKVTDDANGKSVIVQINDRGPFVKGRIIDLDRESFAKIAPLGAGVINVRVEPILN